MKLLIIDNYDSFTFNLVQLIEQAGVTNYLIVKNDNLKEVNPTDFERIIISPGPGIAKEAGQLQWFLKEHYKTKPILGICLGNEAIAELFGAKLVPLSKPMHGIKNRAHIIKKTTIFNDMPDTFNIGHYHSWIVDEKTIPTELEIIIRDELGHNMALSHINYNIVGLQFHPESIMTDCGLIMVKNWLQLT